MCGWWVATKVIDEKEESHCSARVEEIKPHPINSHEKKRQSHESVMTHSMLVKIK
jgi:hypothetical protein